MLFRSTMPDLVILDIMMPGADGLSICSRLRQISATLPIIIVSAKDSPFDRVTGLTLGSDDYLIKPFLPLGHVFVLTDIGEDENGHIIRERRNGHGARVYGANIDARIAHGKEAQFQLGFTAQRSRYTSPVVWREELEDGSPELATSRMLRTPDYYGYFTFTSAPTKNFDFSLSGTYTGKMTVDRKSVV